MSTLDEITKEKQRVGEALARVDAQREKLTGRLGERQLLKILFSMSVNPSRGGARGSRTRPTARPRQ